MTVAVLELLPFESSEPPPVPRDCCWCGHRSLAFIKNGLILVVFTRFVRNRAELPYCKTPDIATRLHLANYLTMYAIVAIKRFRNIQAHPYCVELPAYG